MNDAQLREQLVTLSREIHDDPETAWNEHNAVARICALLEHQGHTVERRVAGVDTAFRARAGREGPSVAFLAEYDALPAMGHACGHNLIAMTNVGAFLEVAREAERLDIGVQLIGTPAEEGGGGKIVLLQRGVFDGVVAALSSHASAQANWVVSEGLLGRAAFHVRFHGVPAHATVSPESGRSALSAVIALFNAVDARRQHLPKGAFANGIITKGGDAVNIIPELAEAHFALRARTIAELDDVVATFKDIANSAALGTGTTVEIVESAPRYEPPKFNAALADLLSDELRQRGKEPVRELQIGASSDICNISQAMPADYIAFPVSPSPIPGHSAEMLGSSASDLAHDNAFVVIGALAAAGRRIATDAAVREALARDHRAE